MAAGTTAPPLSSDDRKAALARAITAQVSAGWRVESQSDYQAVLVKGKRPNHILHLLLSVITLFLWAIFVWLPLAIFMGERRRVLYVDEYGAVQVNRA